LDLELDDFVINPEFLDDGIARLRSFSREPVPIRAVASDRIQRRCAKIPRKKTSLN